MDPQVILPCSQLPTTSPKSYLFKHYINIILLSKPKFSGGPFLKFFHQILYAFLFSLLRATCPVHLNILDLITPKLIGDYNKERNSVLRRYIQLIVTYSVFGKNSFLISLYSRIFLLGLYVLTSV